MKYIYKLEDEIMHKIKLVYIKGAEVGTRKLQSYPLGLMLIKAYAESIKEIKEQVDITIDVLDYDTQDEAFVYDVYTKKYNKI